MSMDSSISNFGILITSCHYSIECLKMIRKYKGFNY